jgi:hypothetical protein
MSGIQVEYSMVVDALPEAIYAVLSDYRVGHPAILPRPPFTELTVEKGGKGAGTVVMTRVKVFGRTTSYHQVVSEPEPGRVLMEKDMDTEQYSTFTLDPLDGGKQTRVTIFCEFPLEPGFVGIMQKLTQARTFVERSSKNLKIWLGTCVATLRS